MGFFSSNCEGCRHPLLSRNVTNETNAWMERAVAIKANGSVLLGDYDGYGRLGDFDDAIVEATVWHKACWLIADSPTDYRGESARAEDQGYFFDEGDHTLIEPVRHRRVVPSSDDATDTDASNTANVDGPISKVVSLINDRLAALPAEYTSARHGAAEVLADLRSDIVSRLTPAPSAAPDNVDTTAAPDMTKEEADRAYDVAALRAALGFLLRNDRDDDEPRCERSTSGIGSCFTLNDRTANARYGDDLACPACIAYYALTGKTIPTGPGVHADEEPGSSTMIVGFSYLPMSMQPGWDPRTPGREAEARFLDACIAEGVDPRDFDMHPDDRERF